MKYAVLTIAISISFVVCAVEAKAEPHKLRDYQLGMTIPEVRAVDFKSFVYDASEVLFIVSTGGHWGSTSKSDYLYYSTFLNEGEKEIGVVIGSLFRPGGGLKPSSIEFGGASLMALKFYFIAPKAGEEPKLFKIQCWTSASLDYLRMKDLYTQALGEPTETKRYKEQNVFGAKFNAEVSVWRNESSEIVVHSSHSFKGGQVFFELRLHELNNLYEDKLTEFRSRAVDEL